MLTGTLLVSAGALVSLLPTRQLRTPVGILAFAQAMVLALTLLHAG